MWEYALCDSINTVILSSLIEIWSKTNHALAFEVLWSTHNSYQSYPINLGKTPNLESVSSYYRCYFFVLFLHYIIGWGWCVVAFAEMDHKQQVIFRCNKVRYQVKIWSSHLLDHFSFVKWDTMSNTMRSSIFAVIIFLYPIFGKCGNYHPFPYLGLLLAVNF